LLTQRDFRPPCSSCGKVVPQLLRPELADVELRTDSREHHGGALPERIGDVHAECWPGATAGARTLRMITINNSYDTTAATAATPTTASAVDHLITRSVALTARHRRPARTRS
jgi:hypothetical protein